MVSSRGSSVFAGFRFPREVISFAVRWYLRYGLSYRDVEELVSARRDLAAARRFFTRALHEGTVPAEVTTDRGPVLGSYIRICPHLTVAAPQRPRGVAMLAAGGKFGGCLLTPPFLGS